MTMSPLNKARLDAIKSGIVKIKEFLPELDTTEVNWDQLAEAQARNILQVLMDIEEQYQEMRG